MSASTLHWLRILALAIAAASASGSVCAAPLLVTAITPLGLQPDGRYHVQL
jgi:hypothetical protein